PAERDGKLYARGATDDKGQIFLHIKAVEAILQQEKQLPVNIKFCVEGEEEVGSPNLPNYGGGVPNALHAMVSLLDSLHDAKGRVTVEGFYEGVPELTEADHAEFAKQSGDENKLKRDLGLDELYGEEGYTFAERTGARPTLELNGVYGGFQGEGSKTVIPKEAHAKITCRLVGHQDPQDILNKIEKHIYSHVPTGAKATVVQFEKGNAFTIDPSTPILQKAAEAYEEVYGTRPVFTRDGGSIPIVETFSRVLAAPVEWSGSNQGGVILKIIPMDAEWLDAMCDLWNGELGGHFPMRRELMKQNTFEDVNVYGPASGLAVDGEGRLLGFVIAKKWQEPAREMQLGDGGGWIQAIVVSRDAQGQGIGSGLLSHAESALRKAGA
ncbi:hypothetical protein BGX30_007295, partial [Mortierella sp. GBA39]